MLRQSKKTRLYPALTLMETVISLSIMAVIFAVLLPQVRAMQNSWDSRAGSAETLQNGRVLLDHLNRNLSKAVSVTGVSDSSQTNGYIEFQDSAANTLRYDIAADNYVEFGTVGSLNDLAGPVSQLLFTCYDGNDMGTAITDGNDIRLVNVQATLTNPTAGGRDMTLRTSVYLRTGPLPGETVDPNLILWLKLDETSGSTALDSSGHGNHGTLTNMDPAQDWVAGHIGNALDFDGGDDYLIVANSSSLQLTVAMTITGWINAGSWGSGTDVDPIVRKGEENPNNYQLAIADQRVSLMLDDSDGNGLRGDTLLSAGQWHFVAGTWDGSVVRIYVDGVLDNDPPDSRTGTIGTDTRSLYSGGRAGSDYFDGTIDDVRVYDYALSGAEIGGLYYLDGPVYQEFTEA